ncbi:alpha/beta hydrolase domain containing protein 1 [Striga asiatica]|uniref:Alpha/beta hydrolase domain containing protein 1 n=1 Tax=Striga asiatica TaxID=4170 RepID=A0A5A7Q350_STRAF|nr:alpha/beta hydrolase domain containing protein 1 [Striga asiatica]
MARAYLGFTTPLSSSLRYAAHYPFPFTFTFTFSTPSHFLSSIAATAVPQSSSRSFHTSLEVIGGAVDKFLPAFKTLHLPYVPYPMVAWNRHVETIFAAFFRSLPEVNFRRECLRTTDDGVVSLDWVSGDDRKLPSDAPLLILLVGLSGGSGDTYVRHMLLQAKGKGWRVVVFNSRGCGDSPVTTAQFYSASFLGDISEVVNHVGDRYPNANLYAIGWSLGANILVRYVGQVRKTHTKSIFASFSEMLSHPYFFLDDISLTIFKDGKLKYMLIQWRVLVWLNCPQELATLRSCRFSLMSIICLVGLLVNRRVAAVSGSRRDVGCCAARVAIGGCGRRWRCMLSFVVAGQLTDEDFRQGFNIVYDKALANALCKIFRRHGLLFEDIGGEFNISLAANAKSVREFDEGLTRVSFGFQSVDEYYSKSSSSDFVKNVTIPLLCIQASIVYDYNFLGNSAENDPIAPSRGIPRKDIQKNCNCMLIVTPKGGHLGWVAGVDAPFGAPWTDPIVMDFLQHLEERLP